MNVTSLKPSVVAFSSDWFVEEVVMPFCVWVGLDDDLVVMDSVVECSALGSLAVGGVS